MEEITLDIISINHSIDNVGDIPMIMQNDSVAGVYPKLSSARWELIPYYDKLLHVRINDRLSDAEVERICESLSMKTFYSLIEEKLSKY